MATVEQQPPQQQGTTQLEFHQAMSDFKTMFPEMDEDVIEAVLRANQGAVDATIDQLLQMTMDNENEKLRSELEKGEDHPPSFLAATGGSPPPSYSQAAESASPGRPPKPPTLQKTVTSHTPPTSRHHDEGACADIPLRIIHNWNPPLLGRLPPTFLRVPTHRDKQTELINSGILHQCYLSNQRHRPIKTENPDPDVAQFLEDERIALFLQNEEFMAELRRNKDFMSTLEKDQASDIESPPEEVHGKFSSRLLGIHDDDAAFKERLRNMGKMSQKKFAQLARMFTRKKKRSSARHILSQGPTPSRDNLLLNSEPLISDDLDEKDEDSDVQDSVPDESVFTSTASPGRRPKGGGQFQPL